MRIIRVALTVFVLLAGPLMNNALADEKAIVQTFYDFLSNPASQEHATAFSEATADNWESIGVVQPGHQSAHCLVSMEKVKVSTFLPLISTQSKTTKSQTPTMSKTGLVRYSS